MISLAVGSTWLVRSPLHSSQPQASYAQHERCEPILEEGAYRSSLPELLAAFGIEDTPENRAIATENIKAMIREKNPGAMIVERKTPQD